MPTDLMNDPVLVKFARFYATIKHAGQLYGGVLPYTHHLQAVDQNVQRFESELMAPVPVGAVTPVFPWTVSDIRASAWLHDILEDCQVRYKELVEQFGLRVATLVSYVTDEEGVSRKVRQALTYPKIRREPAAVFLKCCDRLANLQAGGAMMDVYREEHPRFREVLRLDGEFPGLWSELDFLIEHRP